MDIVHIEGSTAKITKQTLCNKINPPVYSFANKNKTQGDYFPPCI